MNGFEMCRIRAGLTQEEAAEAIGVRQGTISAWETDRNFPTGRKIAAILKVYGCRADELYAPRKGIKKPNMRHLRKR